MNNPFQNAAQNLFANNNNNNNNGRRRVAALERQDAINIALLRRIIDEQNALAPKSPVRRNKRARLY
jgi:hypothetical protein